MEVWWLPRTKILARISIYIYVCIYMCTYIHMYMYMCEDQKAVGATKGGPPCMKPYGSIAKSFKQPCQQRSGHANICRHVGYLRTNIYIYIHTHTCIYIYIYTHAYMCI